MRFIIRLFAVACSTIAALSAGTASAEKRVALVIGNADYKVGSLADPVNDATAVAGKFEKVLLTVEDSTLVVYAAKDTTADDSTRRRHSPLTQALLNQLATPGLEINFVFRRMRDDVN
jgi:uncharacterized caspase-like protein